MNSNSLLTHTERLAVRLGTHISLVDALRRIMADTADIIDSYSIDRGSVVFHYIVPVRAHVFDITREVTRFSVLLPAGNVVPIDSPADLAARLRRFAETGRECDAND